MTGFGRATEASDKWQVSAEVSSVNKKLLDFTLAMPRGLAECEIAVAKLLRDKVCRGQIRCSVRVEALDAGESAPTEAIEWVERLRATAKRLNLKDDLAASCLARCPALESASDVDASDAPEIAPVLLSAIGKAMDALIGMRSEEGANLKADLAARLDAMKAMASQIAALAPAVPVAHRAKLIERLQALKEEAPNADDPSVLREIALYVDRCDISEELTRLESHFKQGYGFIASEEPSGRHLDFLCQEMSREINTIGSKANSAEISALVTRFKAMLEAFREQVQNVE